MAQESESKKQVVRDTLSSIHKDVEFTSSSSKYNILVEYNTILSTLSLTFVSNNDSSAIYKQLFNEQHIQIITNKCHLNSKSLYELLSLQLSSNESIDKCFRIYKDSDIQSLINKYIQFNKMSTIPTVIPDSPVLYNNASVSTNYSLFSLNELPLGWAKLQDDNGFYYFNVMTSESQRNRPTITEISEEKINEIDITQQNYLLFVFHFAPSKYIHCNYCFILKQTQSNIMPILPPFLSVYRLENNELLKTIHLIENMRIPRSIFDNINEYNKTIICSMIAEFPNTFREILYLTQRRHLSTIDSGHDPRKNSQNNLLTHDDPYYGMSARSRRVAITKNVQQRKHTVPPPSQLEMDILKNLNEPINKFIPNFNKISSINKKINLKFRLNYNDVNIDINEYKHFEYSSSALIYNQTQKTNTYDCLFKILKEEIDLFNENENEYVFETFDGINNVNYFDLILRIIYSLPFGARIYKEKLLIMLLESVRNKKKSHILQQKLLFLYWSFVKNGDKGCNYMDSDLYLSNYYACIILFSLSKIINKENVFILDCTKCWNR
eukprot:196828_1